MSLKTLQEEFEKERASLLRQISATREYWSDNVQRRYYAQFLDIYPLQMGTFLKGLQDLEETISKAIRSAESLEKSI